MPDKPPTNWELFTAALTATPDEVSMMIIDLVRKLGSLRSVEIVTGLKRRSLQAWKEGESVPERPARRAVFLVWCMVCRPEELQGVTDLMTWGRFTERANPATAGTGKIKRNLTRLYEGPPEFGAGQH